MKAARFSPRHRAKTRSIRSDIAGILSADFSPRETMTLSSLANGYILDWSVAWPPGPINAEMIRRGLLRRIVAADSGLPGRLVLARAPAIHLGLWRFRRRRGPAQLGRDPARASDRRSRTALTSSGSFRHWGVEIYRAHR